MVSKRILLRYFVLATVLIALLSTSALTLSVAAQSTPTPVQAIIIDMYEFGGSSAQFFAQDFQSRGMQPGDKVLIYMHGAFGGNVYDDLGFAQTLAAQNGYKWLVALEFPTSTWSGEAVSVMSLIPLNPTFWAFNSAVVEHAQNVANIAQGINQITSPPDVFGFSRGGLVAVQSLNYDVHYGTVVLAGYPYNTQIPADNMAKAAHVYSFWSNSDTISNWMGGRNISGPETIYRANVGHGEWNDLVRNAQPSPLISDYGQALRGQPPKSDPPSSGSVSPGNVIVIPGGSTQSAPPLLPPNDPNGGGGGAVVSPNGSSIPLFMPPTLPEGGLVLSGLPSNPGGVDFSSLQLRYFSEYSDGDALNVGYAFQANKAQGGIKPVDVQGTAKNTSDAFFVWLALPPETFWVNLNPNEPDRIIDSELGQTDAGRIMLEADFQMKKTVAGLIHPESQSGKAFWDDLYAYAGKRNATALCFSFRQWIVPGEVTVWETADSIYITKAALDVKMESEYLKLKGEDNSTSAACPPDADPEIQAYAEKLFREKILPQVVNQVNTAPEYQDIRSILYARVLAEWYKDQRARDGKAAFNNLIGRGSTCNCYPRINWNAQSLFDQYVQSISKGEFNITQTEQTQQGNMVITSTRTYFYGGVDFTNMPVTQIADKELLAQNPSVEQDVVDALLRPTGYTNDASTWLGGSYFAGVQGVQLGDNSGSGKGSAPTPNPQKLADANSAEAHHESEDSQNPTQNPTGSTGRALPCGIGFLPAVLIMWLVWRFRRAYP